MKQVLQNLKTGDTEVAEVPVPKPGPGFVLIKTHCSLVSAGTEKSLVDFSKQNLVGKARSRPEQVRQVLQAMKKQGILETIQVVKDRLDESVALGYSSSGEIVEIGDNVEGLSIGNRVSCSGAGYAVHGEYAVVPKNLVCKIPDNVSYEHAAFTTLGAIALHGLRLSQPNLGDTLCVIGLGLVGLLVVQLAKNAGCNVIGFDPNIHRCELAKTLGARHISSNIDTLKEIIIDQTDSIGCDKTIITAATTSNEPIELAGDITRDKGSVVAIGAVGLKIPRKTYYEKEIQFQVSRSYGPGRYDSNYEEDGTDYPIGFVRWTQNRNMQTFLDLTGQGLMNIKALITHRFPIDQAGEAYDIILNPGTSNVIGTLLEYPPTTTNAKIHHKIEYKHNPPKPLNKNTIQIGLIGAGGFSRSVLIPTIKKIKDVNITAVCTTTGHSGAEAARKFGFKFAATSAEEIFTSSAITAVVIATQHNSHAKLAIEALKAGKHVFTEKPLCLNTEELKEITQVAQSVPESNLMVGFNRRFSKMSLELRNLVQSINQPSMINYRINAGYVPKDHWTQQIDKGGGRLLGEVCHFIDLLCFITDDLPYSISTHKLPNKGKYNDDNLLITVEFKGGSIGSITYVANSHKSLNKERIELFTGESYAMLDDFHTLTINRKGKKKVLRSRFKQDKGYLEELTCFTSSIKDGLESPISLKSLHATTLTTLLAKESLEKNTKLFTNL